MTEVARDPSGREVKDQVLTEQSLQSRTGGRERKDSEEFISCRYREVEFGFVVVTAVDERKWMPFQLNGGFLYKAIM